MNENEIKKTPEQIKSPTSDNTKVDNDLEIFDFDAHRKAKAETETKTSHTATAPTVRKPQSEGVAQKASLPRTEVGKPSMQDPTVKPRSTPTPSTPTGGTNRNVARPQSTQASSGASVPKTPATPHPNPQSAPKVTDIKPDRVVFDSSLRGAMRTPSTNRSRRMKSIKPQQEKTRGANPIAVISKALIYIAIVLLISGLASYFIIMVANDVFAFVKSDAQIEIAIPEYATLDQIAEELHENKIIKYPKIFVLYTIIRDRDPGVYKSGKFTVSPSQNYDMLLSTFIERKTNTMTEISVTIPEGYTIDDIITLFVEEKGMGTKEGFINAIQNGEYDYWFVKDLTDLNPNRKYRLEGYLYPDTYYFYKEWPEERIIDKILANFYAKFDIKYKQECEKAGMSVDDVVNLASIIQMEAKYTRDYTHVSSVIHNRLNSAYYNYRLDCDATIQYALPERKEDLGHEDTLIDHPYNSYKNGGLPPGPISNPTIKAIRAALYPDNTNYYFFVSDINGEMLFASTLPQHNQNIAKVEANAAAQKAQNGGN